MGPQNGPRYRSCHLRGQKSLGPLKMSQFCARNHFESLNWPYLGIWQGRLDNTKPNLKHSCIVNLMQPVLNSFLRPLFGVGLFFGAHAKAYQGYRQLCCHPCWCLRLASLLLLVSLLLLSSLLLLAVPAVSGIPCCCWCSCCVPGVDGIFAACIPADPDIPILVGVFTYCTYCTMRHIRPSDSRAIKIVPVADRADFFNVIHSVAHTLAYVLPSMFRLERYGKRRGAYVPRLPAVPS
jgi:hypothetical protein